MAGILSEYIERGIEVNMELNEIRVDLSNPRVLRVVARDEKNQGPVKEYFLKVTPRGGLVLV